LASDQTTLTIPAEVSAREDIPYAPEHLPQSQATKLEAEKYPYIRAEGPMEATRFQMLESAFGDAPPTGGSQNALTLSSALASISLLVCGAIAGVDGLNLTVE